MGIQTNLLFAEQFLETLRQTGTTLLLAGFRRNCRRAQLFLLVASARLERGVRIGLLKSASTLLVVGCPETKARQRLQLSVSRCGSAPRLPVKRLPWVD